MKAIDVNEEIAIYLLETGAKPYGWNKDGKTALDWAIQKNNKEIEALIREAME